MRSTARAGESSTETVTGLVVMISLTSIVQAPRLELLDFQMKRSCAPSVFSMRSLALMMSSTSS